MKKVVPIVKVASKKYLVPKAMKISSEFLQDLRESMIREELAIPVYTTHITEGLFWSGIDKETQKKIVALLKSLKKDSLGHARSLRKVERVLAKHVS